ncbi:MAG: HlyC/CorC family transporter, partial [Sandaracinaceae bacterium]|nr:HlyC/CorC family transporter [Sandaracinaceae bacterium]
VSLRSDPERLLATVQVGITVIGATTAVLGGARLEEPLAALLASLGLGALANEIALVLIVAMVSYLSVVLGELVPKSLALAASERFALLVARPLVVVAAIARPIVWILTASSNTLLRLFRDRTNFSESRLSPDELQQLVEEAAATGSLHESAGTIASRAIDLGKLRASALMTPRTRMVTLDLAATSAEVLDVLRARPHARYPVVDGSPDLLVGYVRARDAYHALARGKPLDLRGLTRAARFFPERALAVDVLRALQTGKQQLAFLVDEHGALAGLITIDDVVEDLVGGVHEEDEVVRPRVWREGEHVIALGEAPAHEVARLSGADFGADEGATTLAGAVLRRAGHVPKPGERIALERGGEVEILEATEREVLRARIRVRTNGEEAGSDGEPSARG